MKKRKKGANKAVPPVRRLNWRREYIGRLRNYFLTGLLVVVPLAFTFLVLRFLVKTADKILAIVPLDIRLNYFIFKIPGLGIVLTACLVVIIGFLARNFLGRKLVVFGERIIERIPLIRSVYSATKQLLETVFAGTGDFERVVLVEYPRPGILSLAFVTGVAENFTREVMPEPHLSLFIPTTPNPTSGWYILVPEKDVVQLDVSVEEAFKLIMSAGMAPPKNVIGRAKHPSAGPKVGAID